MSHQINDTWPTPMPPLETATIEELEDWVDRNGPLDAEEIWPAMWRIARLQMTIAKAVLRLALEKLR